ncbi:hypothetical protein OTB20_18840 [Streptomyces sp. H27-H1]|uniref:hypothetical protein n=1 Tax=Streptomyces sp. H27-H1 TaxID=2996461 RepID=UPI002271A4EE|nr:hypothetical protein [Streptomyces sp. H27-H1]MCY0928215.1 hypothetical protein [Streptomyces sp. H27-H1]
MTLDSDARPPRDPGEDGAEPALGPAGLRRLARLEAGPYLAGLGLPDPGRAVRAWADQGAQAPSAAALHLLVEGATGADGALLGLRDLLRAAAAWCRDHEEPALARRYTHTSDLFDVADRLLYQLGVDLLTAAHEVRSAP